MGALDQIDAWPAPTAALAVVRPGGEIVASPIARPGERRIYSNAGIEAVAALVEERAGQPFASLAPEGWAGRLQGSPAYGYAGPLACLTDLAFGDWASEAWPRLSDAVLAEL